MKLSKSCRLLFIGDSITDCGRAWPAGEGDDQALGNGYVSLVSAFLTAAHPELYIHVMNTGVSGDTVRDLDGRWERDVLSLKPDWLSIMIGINDVWRQFDGLWEFGSPISLGEYSETLGRLIAQVRPRLQGLVLMTPYHLEPDVSHPMRRRMDQFGAAVGELAAKHGAILVDTQNAFDRLMAHIPPDELAQDRVHVGLPGHMVLAQSFLSGVGCSLPRCDGDE